MIMNSYFSIDAINSDNNRYPQENSRDANFHNKLSQIKQLS